MCGSRRSTQRGSIALGSLFSSSIARALGVLFVHALFDRDRVKRVRQVLESPRAKLSFFLLFLIPGLPRDILCYAAALSSIRLLVLLSFSTMGRLPARG